MTYEYKNIRMVHLETTQLCQASCPMCDRNMNGGDVNPYLKNKSLNPYNTSSNSKAKMYVKSVQIEPKPSLGNI